jgi:RNA polymerase sigma-70 factor (ECF subfamily)
VKELIFNEQELIKQCQRNDRQAQELLFNNHYDQLYGLAMRYLGDHHDTEDAIVIAFTRVFKKLGGFVYQGKGSLGKWIRTILINEAIRILKKRNVLLYDENTAQLDIQSVQPDGLQQLHGADIIKLIEQLPAGYRTVFNLYVVEGYSHKEIAAMLGISENTSKSQLSKARNHLIDKLNGNRAYGTI